MGSQIDRFSLGSAMSQDSFIQTDDQSQSDALLSQDTVSVQQHRLIPLTHHRWAVDLSPRWITAHNSLLHTDTTPNHSVPSPQPLLLRWLHTWTCRDDAASLGPMLPTRSTQQSRHHRRSNGPRCAIGRDQPKQGLSSIVRLSPNLIVEAQEHTSYHQTTSALPHRQSSKPPRHTPHCLPRCNFYGLECRERR